MGESHISTQALQARTAAASRSAWIATIAIPLMLLAPALWNGYPLLQWDTGGYLARWYEGYLVPSRSTTFGETRAISSPTWISPRHTLGLMEPVGRPRSSRSKGLRDTGDRTAPTRSDPSGLGDAYRTKSR